MAGSEIKELITLLKKWILNSKVSHNADVDNDLSESLISKCKYSVVDYLYNLQADISIGQLLDIASVLRRM